MPLKISYQDALLGQTHPDKVFQFMKCGRLFREGRFVNENDKVAELWIRNGRVIDPEKLFFEERKCADFQVDCGGLILAPGFLDLQVNGAFGVDFTSSRPEEFLKGLQKVARNLLQFGVTGFCPTLISARSDVYKSLLPLLNDKTIINEPKNQAKILGIHLEGPFISGEKRGCHPIECIKSDFGDNPSQTLESTYCDLSNVAYITIAPELDKAAEAIQYLTSKGIPVSLGHSNGTFEEGQRAVRAGANGITHLFNAMKPFHHREPGLIGLLGAARRFGPIYCGIIADGIHTREAALQLSFAANPNGILLVTDCISAVGLGDGLLQLGDQKVVVKGNLALLEGMDNTLAGSVSTMPECIRNFAKSVGFESEIDGLEEALRAATYNQALFLNIQEARGTLRVGSEADFILIDSNVNIHSTFMSGVKSFCQ